MTESLLPPAPPALGDLVQARRVLTALREYLESPDGRKRVGRDTPELEAAIGLLGLVLERYSRATLMDIR